MFVFARVLFSCQTVDKLNHLPFIPSKRHFPLFVKLILKFNERWKLMKSRKRGARSEASTQTEKLPEVKSVSVQIEELSVLIQDFLNLSHRVKKK